MFLRKSLFVFSIIITLFLVQQQSLAQEDSLVESEISAPTALVAKQLAGGAEEIAGTTLPDAKSIINQSQHAILTVELDGKNSSWTGEIAVDDPATATLVLLAPDQAKWQTSVTMPSGKRLVLDNAGSVTVSKEHFGFEDQQQPSTVYRVANGENGRWQVTIAAKSHNKASELSLVEEDASVGYLIVASESPYKINTHLTTTSLVAGQAIGINAYISHGDLAEVADATISRAELVLALEDGSQQIFGLFDDGLHEDEAANDGRYGIVFNNLDAGNYRAQVVIHGQTAKGIAFIRTSELVFPVIAPAYALTGATIEQGNGERLDVALQATQLGFDMPKIFAYGEIWGTNAAGEQIPAAWLGGMTTPQKIADTSNVTLPLSIDARWLLRAEVEAPFTLRNVRLQDATTYVPISQLAEIGIEIGEITAEYGKDGFVVDEAMRMGERPKLTSDTNTQTKTASDGLLLVHGYCSSLMWPASQFNDGPSHIFSDTNQNRSHDAFAQLIKNQGDAAFSNSYSIVAHSQGGAATLHLYTNYWSGLDYSNAQRLIQSVGTPYQGTTLAGSLAWLGDIFGAGCGTNWDLTHEGAALWLATVPGWARDKVNYYTTSHKDSWWPWQNLCHATSYVIGGLDDGVVAKSKGQLSGGHDRGHSNQQCHTTGMVYSAQYHDSGRNAAMDSYARP